jgi:hypothetical protein
MILTPTKAHDQFMPALGLISKSLKLYRHGEIEAIYTDSLSDKTVLEKIFLPLLKDVIPVSDNSDLPLCQIPDSYTILTLSSIYQINARLNELMNSLEGPLTTELHVGFDMEWSVDTISGIQGRVAVIQIAYEEHIYLIQVFNTIIQLLLLLFIYLFFLAVVQSAAG